MPNKLKRAIWVVKDQTSISLAKVAGAPFSDLEVAILKSTTHDDVLPINDKHVRHVLRLVSSNKFYAAACARTLGKRIGRTCHWVVALKSLMLTLRLFQDGDPYFPREVFHAMKRGARILNLSTFRDVSNTSSPWDFSSFVRTFALYLNERLECFLTGNLQRRYTRRTSRDNLSIRWGKSMSRRTNEPLRDIKPSTLLDNIFHWQGLLQRAIATRPTGVAKTNHLVQASLYAIVQESFDLYKDISDAISFILDSFYHLQYQNCVNAFQMIVKARQQFKELNEFYSLCKSIDIGRRSEYPTVQTISTELLDTLQEYLNDEPKPKNSPLLAIEACPQNGHKEHNLLLLEQTPLEDLIKATETVITKRPDISIDLEAYPAPKQDDDTFMTHNLSSTKSLPISSPLTDLMSLWDWSEQEKSMDLSDSKNWEVVLAETMSSSSSQIEEKHSIPTADDYTRNWEVVLFQETERYYNPFLEGTGYVEC